MPKIAIAGFQHETNPFGATHAQYHDFELADSWPGMLMGEAIFDGLKNTTLPLWGFIEAAQPHAQLIPIIWCAAEPSSFVTDDAFERITDHICDGIKGAGVIDGIYLDLHGAMMTQSHNDGEGELLARIRQIVGDALPIAVSLDSHANISEAMVEHADAITVFRSYPHLDMHETGARCWPLMKSLLGGTRPIPALRKAPFLIPMHAQYTGIDPLRGIYQRIKALDSPPSQWAELAVGFPPSDTKDTGPTILAWGATSTAAENLADNLMAEVLAAEAHFDCTTLSAEAAVAEAIHLAHSASKPIILADIEDNPGAGASADTTGLLAALVWGGAKGAALAMLHDPELASHAHNAGIGAVFETKIGGKVQRPHLPPPFECRVIVEALSTGRFAFTGAMYRGLTADTGASALLRIDDEGAEVRVIISSKRCQCLDQAVLTHFGVIPEQCRILALKSTVHFRADFEAIAAKIINVATPGLNPCNHEAADFKGLRDDIRLTPMGRAFHRS